MSWGRKAIARYASFPCAISVSWHTLKGVIIMDILHLVDRLEMLVNKGWRLPFTSNVVIQEDAFLDVIDQMRISIPEEVKHAKRVSADRSGYWNRPSKKRGESSPWHRSRPAAWRMTTRS